MSEKRTLREHFAGWATYVLLATALPRVAHWLRWPTRLGPRGLLAYIAGNTLLLFGLRHYLLPHFKRFAEERHQLEAQLGREASDEELAEHFEYGTRD